MVVPKLHILVPKLAFWRNFITVLKLISARNLKNASKLSKNVVLVAKTMTFDKKVCKEICFPVGFKAGW